MVIGAISDRARIKGDGYPRAYLRSVPLARRPLRIHSWQMMSRASSNAVRHDEASAQTDWRRCEWSECEGIGVHRAPKSRDDLKTFRWFCLEHAREYNRAWNYYDGMSDQEVEADMRRDIVWHRPTWPLGNSPETLDPNGLGFSGFDDPLGIFEGQNGHRFSSAEARDLGLDAEQRHAMAVLGVEGPFNVEIVKTRYKALVKRHHPDANGDDGASDDKIKEINQAYQVVMEFLAP